MSIAFFRQTALGLTNMWSQLRSDLPTGIVRLCLERSVNAPLHVVFNEEDEEYSPQELRCPQNETQLKVKDFVAEVVKSCSRWETIKFYMPFSEDRTLELESNSYSLYLWLAREICDLKLPALQSLSIEHQGCLPDERGEEMSGSKEGILSQLYFYIHWRAPNLRSFSFAGIIPAPIKGASVEVLDLDLQVNSKFMDFSVAFQDLLAFLIETPSLRELTLRVPSAGRTYGRQTSPFQTIVLENLRAVTFFVAEMFSTPVNSVPLASFVRCLHIPNLLTFALRIFLVEPSEAREEHERDYINTKLMNDLIPNSGINSRLEDLSILVYDYESESTPKISILIDNHPSLRTMTVGINGKTRLLTRFNKTYLASDSQVVITLQDRKHGMDDFLSWVSDELHGSGSREEPEWRVRKFKLKHISKSLYKLMTPDQMEVEEYRSDSKIRLWVGKTKRSTLKEVLQLHVVDKHKKSVGSSRASILTCRIKKVF